MSFDRLYAAVQAHDCPISTRWLKEKAIELSSITRIQEQWSSIIDHTAIRGFYIEGPLGPPVPLGLNESLIVLSRTMCKGHQGDYWRRFVYTKELMHVFDTAEEKASDEKSFDTQIEKFGDPAAGMSPQYRAEIKALWRALGVLCPEATRKHLRASLESNSISYDVVSATLRLPVIYVRELMRPDFEGFLKASM